MYGGEALIETLLAHRVDTAFTVPGESFLATLEAVRQRHGRMRLLSMRHESGAGFAADAFARLTGRPAAVMVSRGPGATNASVSLHTARQDSVPMFLMMGQVKRAVIGREAFQEIDPASAFASMTKAVLQPADVDAIPSTTSEALRVALAGRAGPVVLVLSRDLDGGKTDAAIPAAASREDLVPEASDLARLVSRLAAARRPLIIAGEAVLRERAQAGLAAFAERIGAPVFASYRRQDIMDNLHPHYAGHLEINRLPYQQEAIRTADLVLALGTRLDGVTTMEMNEDILPSISRLVQVYPDSEVVGRFPNDVAIVADLAPTLERLIALVPNRGRDGQSWVGPLHDAYLASSKPAAHPAVGAVDLGQAVALAADLAGDDAITVTDGGSFARWVHRFLRVRRPGAILGPAAGAMGYAVPGAVGAAVARPDRRIVVWVGDGGFMMTGQELATIAEHGLRVTVIVCDNGAQGSILAGQRKNYGPGNDIGTCLRSPDFAALGRAYGVPAWTVENTAAFASALTMAFDIDGPALLHVKTDQRDITPYDD